jgi:hypothetical protein
MQSDKMDGVKISNIAIGISRGDRAAVEELKRIISEMGGEWRETENGEIFFTVSGVRTGLIVGMSDPITCVVSILFALYGPLWTALSAAKEAFEMTDKKWRESIRASRKALKKKEKKGGD